MPEAARFYLKTIRTWNLRGAESTDLLSDPDTLHGFEDGTLSALPAFVMRSGCLNPISRPVCR